MKKSSSNGAPSHRHTGNINQFAAGRYDQTYARVTAADVTERRRARRNSAVIALSIVLALLVMTLVYVLAMRSLDVTALGDDLNGSGSQANVSSVEAHHNANAVTFHVSADGWTSDMGAFRFNVLSDGVLVGQINASPDAPGEFVPTSREAKYELVPVTIPSDAAANVAFRYPASLEFTGHDGSVSLAMERIDLSDSAALSSAANEMPSKGERESAEGYYEDLRNEYLIANGEIGYNKAKDETLSKRLKSYEIPEFEDEDEDEDANGDDKDERADVSHER